MKSCPGRISKRKWVSVIGSPSRLICNGSSVAISSHGTRALTSVRRTASSPSRNEAASAAVNLFSRQLRQDAHVQQAVVQQRLGTKLVSAAGLAAVADTEHEESRRPRRSRGPTGVRARDECC